MAVTKLCEGLSHFGPDTRSVFPVIYPCLWVELEAGYCDQEDFDACDGHADDQERGSLSRRLKLDVSRNGIVTRGISRGSPSQETDKMSCTASSQRVPQGIKSSSDSR